jgi:predicted alpha/beta-fold hydrolase
MRSPQHTGLHGRIIQSRFRPHPLLRNAHVQTMLPALLRPLPRLDLRKERIELPDGDFVDLGWAGEHNAHAPIAVLVHGLTGGFESKYLRGFARQVIRLGWRVVAVQLRGAGTEPNRVARMYHQGDTADLRYVWALLHQREPQTLLAATGWSLGGNVVLKALGEEGDQCRIAFAAAVCPPFRLRQCAEHLRQGFSRNYQARMLRDLGEHILRKQTIAPAPATVNIAAALKAQDFFEFDDAWTAPLNGFRDAEDYYARSECGPYLKAIRRPTLIVHAKDDPFMGPDILPAAEDLSPYVTLELPESGGHVGFIRAGRYGQPEFWLERHLAEYFDNSLKTQK